MEICTLEDTQKNEEVIRLYQDLEDSVDKQRYQGCFQCEKCHKQFIREKFFLQHQLKCNVNKEGKILCEECNKEFKTVNGLRQHQRGSHISKENTNLLHCSFCQYTSLKESSLKHHIDNRHGPNIPKPEICKTCGKGFQRKSALLIHEEVHNKVKQYMCTVPGCKYETLTSANLKQHRKRMHSATKDCQTCRVCNTMLASKASLKTHMERHMTSKPYLCEVCNKEFSGPSEFSIHKKIHQEKKECCQAEGCNKKFSTKLGLQRHMLIHTGEKPYSCSYCNYKCNLKGNLNKHCKKKHRTQNIKKGSIQVKDRIPKQKNMLQSPLSVHIQKPAAIDLVECVKNHNSVDKQAHVNDSMKRHSRSPHKTECQSKSHLKMQTIDTVNISLGQAHIPELVQKQPLLSAKTVKNSNAIQNVESKSSKLSSDITESRGNIQELGSIAENSETTDKIAETMESNEEESNLIIILCQESL